MAYKVQFQWEIKDFTRFIEHSSNGKVREIESDIFLASPDNVLRQWKIQLLNGNGKKSIGIYLFLKNNAIVERPISVQHYFEFSDFNDVMFRRTLPYNRTFGFGAGSWGFPNISLFETLAIKSLNFTKPIRVTAFLEFKDPSSNSYSLQGLYFYETKLYKKYKSQKYCDLSIDCGGKIFKAHKLVLASSSPVLDTSLGIKNEENGLASLKLHDISPEVFEDILEFVYTGNISMDYEKAKLLLEVTLKYEFTGLQDICLCKMQSSLSVSNAVEILTIMDKNMNLIRKKQIMFFIKKNISEVVNSDGWKGIMIHRADLMDEIIRHVHS